MPLEAKMEKIPPHMKDGNDPRQHCVQLMDDERRHCVYYAVPGTLRCPIHGGRLDEMHQVKQNLRSYKLAQWRADLDRFQESDGLKSLREEIAISRMTLESILSQCEDKFDLMLAAPKIAMMLEKIQGLVVNCNKLEDRLGLVLDKSAILNLAEEIVQIVGAHVPEETQALIADRIIEAVEKSGQVPIKALT
jgi:hypothetical protein